MKKLIFSLALLLSVTGVQAQSARFGLKGGLSVASYVGDAASSSSSARLGIHAGVLANLGINDKFSFQPELLYSQKGVKDQANFGSGTISGVQTLHYLDIPFMLKLSLTGLFFEAGPQVGVLLAAKQEITGGGQSMSDDNKAAFRDLDFGFALGAGYRTAGGFMLGLRYNRGITNIPKPVSLGSLAIEPAISNSVFQFSLGYLFGEQ